MHWPILPKYHRVVFTGPHKCLGTDEEALAAFLSVYIVLSALHQLASTSLLPVTVCSLVLPRRGEGPHKPASPLHVWGLAPAVARFRSAATSEAGGCETAVDLPLLNATGVFQGTGIPLPAIRLLDCTYRGSTGKGYALLKPVPHQILNLPQVSLDR